MYTVHCVQWSLHVCGGKAFPEELLAIPNPDLQCLAFVELISSSSTRPLCFLSGRNDAFWLLSEMIRRQM